jgi:hypothetical protein
VSGQTAVSRSANAHSEGCRLHYDESMTISVVLTSMHGERLVAELFFASFHTDVCLEHRHMSQRSSFAGQTDNYERI